MTPGAIVHLHFRHIAPPKPKLAVLLHVLPRIGFFLVNSRINKFVHNRAELVKAQVPMLCADHDCLTHNSFLDCTEVHGGYTRDELDALVAAGHQIERGQLSQGCRNLMIMEVAESRLIPQRKKDWILAAFADNHEQREHPRHLSPQ